jgi:hypothetical protein
MDNASYLARKGSLTMATSFRFLGKVVFVREMIDEHGAKDREGRQTAVQKTSRGIIRLEVAKKSRNMPFAAALLCLLWLGPGAGL